MDYFKGVQVEVICNGKSLKMYDDPDGPDDPELYKRQKYVEAITGDKFTVKVTLGHDFQFGSAEAARINFRFDQISHGWYKDMLKSSWRSLRCESYELSSIASFCPVSATWKRKEFSFGGLIRSKPPFGQRLIWNSPDMCIYSSGTPERRPTPPGPDTGSWPDKYFHYTCCTCEAPQTHS